MAQRSVPQAGSGVGDAGPYTSDQWAELFQAVFTGDQQAVQGPLPRAWNELEVTKLGLTIITDTGIGFVYGHCLINDVAVGITIALAAAGLERYDRVVMVQNNTNAAYNTNLALPAAYAAGVPRNSARIAILQGAEAGVAVLPPLLTGPNYYMVELARYLVIDAAVGTIVDYRNPCEFASNVPGPEAIPNRTRQFWVPVECGTTGLSYLGGMSLLNPGACVHLYHDSNDSAGSRFVPPADYVSDMIVTAIYSTADTNGGNAYVDNQAIWAECSEVIETHSTATGLTAVTSLGAGFSYYYNCVLPLTITPAPGVNDFIQLQFVRDGDHASDTENGTLYFLGWRVRYTADS